MPVTYRYLNTSNTSAPASRGEGRHRSHLCAFSLLFSTSFSWPSHSLCVSVCIGSLLGLLAIQHLMWCQIQCSEAEISRKWRTERAVMNIHKPAKRFFCWKEAASVSAGNSCPNLNNNHPNDQKEIKSQIIQFFFLISTNSWSKQRKWN